MLMTQSEQPGRRRTARQHPAIRTALALLVLMAAGGCAVAAQQQIRGQVVNRDRVPQQCQLTFYSGANAVYRLTADRQGYFYITNPRYGTYRIVIVQGNRQTSAGATIDQRGLNPAQLMVPW